MFQLEDNLFPGIKVSVITSFVIEWYGLSFVSHMINDPSVWMVCKEEPWENHSPLLALLAAILQEHPALLRGQVPYIADCVVEDFRHKRIPNDWASFYIMEKGKSLRSVGKDRMMRQWILQIHAHDTEGRFDILTGRD